MSALTLDPDGLWVYRAHLIRVVDGDTAYLMVDHGMFIRSAQSIRLAGVDTPEIFSGTDEEKRRGQLAKAFTEDWFASMDDGSEWPVRLVTLKDRRSFNRYVGHIGGWNGEDLATDLLAAGHGTPA